MTTPTTPDGPAAMPALPALISVKQTSQILGLAPRTTYRLIEAGVIPIMRVGRSIRVITHKFYATFGIPLDQPLGGPTDDDQDLDGDVTPPDHTGR